MTQGVTTQLYKTLQNTKDNCNNCKNKWKSPVQLITAERENNRPSLIDTYTGRDKAVCELESTGEKVRGFVWGVRRLTGRA